MFKPNWLLVTWVSTVYIYLWTLPAGPFKKEFMNVVVNVIVYIFLENSSPGLKY